jgi:hypothetical protein
MSDFPMKEIVELLISTMPAQEQAKISATREALRKMSEIDREPVEWAIVVTSYEIIDRKRAQLNFTPPPK